MSTKTGKGTGAQTTEKTEKKKDKKTMLPATKTREPHAPEKEEHRIYVCSGGGGGGGVVPSQHTRYACAFLFSITFLHRFLLHDGTHLYT